MASRIYTRTGDHGVTGLFGGQRVSKDDIRVEAYGASDELNAVLGVALSQCADLELKTLLLSIQTDLFQLGADLATPLEEPTERGKVSIHRMNSDNIERLERLIDHYESELPGLKQFILPGGHPLSAALQHSRAVCRRAERRCVALHRSQRADGSPIMNEEVLRYLNRLSDLLFVLARVANHRNDVPDIPWNP